MAKSVQFSADVRRRFTVEDLSVTTSVLGRSHTFEFESHSITLSLPTESPADAPDWAARTRKTGWRTADPANPDTTIHSVFDIDLSTNVAARIAIDERAFSEPVNSQHATPQQVKNLKRVADDYARLLSGAWDHWQTTTRWIAGHRSVGRARARVGKDPHGASAASIYRRTDQRKIWVETSAITLLGETPFDPVRWQLLQDAFSSGHRYPIWFSFISEAQHRLESFDKPGAIASAAIACETLVRSMFWLNVPQVHNAKARELIDRSPAQAIIGGWAEIAGPRPSGKWETKAIHRLFDMRNRLMHSGEAPASTAEVRKILSAATAFVDEADTVYCVRAGIENWPARYRSLAKGSAEP